MASRNLKTLSGLMLTTAQACLLTGCLGGSGGSASLSASTASEVRFNYGVLAVNSDAAYDLNVTGDGVIVAVVDSGIDTDHIDLANNISNLSTGFVGGASVSVEDLFGHGTAVAGIIAAEKNDLGQHGIAYEADILALNVNLGNGIYGQSDIATATDYASNNGAQIINYSFAGQYATGTVVTNAMQNAVNNGALIVVAAGNDGDALPDYPARNAGDFGGAPGGVLAVGSVNSVNQIAAHSNRAGIIMNDFVVAPGEFVTSTYLNDQTGVLSGTSFAAAHVSGAAALILDHSSHLTGSQVASILKTTATDLGAAGVDSVYGHGLVNIAAALQPVGATALPTSASVDGPAVTAASTSLQTTAGLGLAFQSSSSLNSAIVLDEYGRAYNFEAGKQAQKPSAIIEMEEWILSNDKDEGISAGGHLTPTRSFNLRYVKQNFASNGTELPASVATLGFIKGEANETLSEQTRVSAYLGEKLSGKLGLGYVASRNSSLAETDTFESPFLGFADQGVSLAVNRKMSDKLAVKLGVTSNMLNGGIALNDAVSTSSPDRQSAFAGDVTYQFNEALKLGVLAGQLYESGTFLDNQGEGAFSFKNKASTNFASIYAALEIMPNVSLMGRYSFGQTDASDINSALVRSFGTLESESFALGLAINGLIAKPGSRYQDKFLLTISQPLRIKSGTAITDVATGRTDDGEIIRTSERLSLAPSGREISAKASYLVESNDDSSLELIGQVRFEPDHDKSADTETIFGMIYKKIF